MPELPTPLVNEAEYQCDVLSRADNPDGPDGSPLRMAVDSSLARKLERENAELRAERDDLAMRLMRKAEECALLQVNAESAEAALEQARKNQQRYLWLRDSRQGRMLRRRRAQT